MRDEDLLGVLDEVVAAVRHALDALDDWGPSGNREGQYRCDVVADEAALSVLEPSGLGVLSEESGLTGGDRDVVVVMDPVDGSTNASLGIPWFATSLCAVDGEGPRVALVVNQATGTRFVARRGGGATCDGRPIAPSGATELEQAVLGLSGYPNRHLGWMQYRALGAAALDLCAVASGTLDGYVDCSPSGLGVWDYLAAMLVCRESGAPVVDASGRDLVVLDHDARRTPVAAASAALLRDVLARWSGQ